MTVILLTLPIPPLHEAYRYTATLPETSVQKIENRTGEKKEVPAKKSNKKKPEKEIKKTAVKKETKEKPKAEKEVKEKPVKKEENKKGDE